MLVTVPVVQHSIPGLDWCRKIWRCGPPSWGLKGFRGAPQNFCSGCTPEFMRCVQEELTVWITYMEIYNENIFDLLESHDKNKPEARPVE